MKFHLDENVKHAIAEGLRRRGIDVTTSTDANLLQASDLNQLAYATSQDRILLTQDQDFLAISGVEHAGIIFWKHGTRSIGHIIREVQTIVDAHLDMKNRIEFI
jgi:predicted nuclease of predicted toxin-antitoxin system